MAACDPRASNRSRAAIDAYSVQRDVAIVGGHAHIVVCDRLRKRVRPQRPRSGCSAGLRCRTRCKPFCRMCPFGVWQSLNCGADSSKLAKSFARSGRRFALPPRSASQGSTHAARTGNFTRSCMMRPCSLAPPKCKREKWSCAMGLCLPTCFRRTYHVPGLNTKKRLDGPGAAGLFDTQPARDI